MKDHVLLPEHSLADFEMQSKLSPENRCVVQDYAVGRTLFMVAGDIEDRCAARWKAHSSSCDILLHAHIGGDCDQLWKLRMISDQCDAPLVVFQSDSALLQCYGARIQEAEVNQMLPLSKACMHPQQVYSLNHSDVSGILPAAFVETSSRVQDRYSNLKAVALSAHGSKNRLRRLIQQAHSSLHPTVQYGLDMNLEFLKKSQGLPSDVAVDDLHTLDERRKRMRATSMIQLSTGEQVQLQGRKEPTETHGLTGTGMALIDQKSSGQSRETIVLDSGSARMRAGFAGEQTPLVVFPMLLTRPKKRKRIRSRG
jgi:hypothetical protein